MEGNSSTNNNSSVEASNVVVPEPKSADERRIHALTGNAKAQDIRAIANAKKDKAAIGDDKLKENETLYIKGCEDCEYVVEGKCTKIYIEGCSNTTITLKGHIITSVVEVWKCNLCNLNIQTKIGTMQVDLCKGMNIIYASKNYYDRLIWAGVHDFSLSFTDSPDHFTKEGFTEMKQKYTDLNEEIDQFIIRFLDGKLVTEQIVRLANGYPTTEREAKEFDEEAKKNAEATEAYVRQLIDAKSSKLGLKRLQKAKVPRNSPCTCGSGKKYKVCCGKEGK